MAQQREREPFWYNIWFWLVFSNLFFIAVYYIWGLIDIGQIPTR